MQYELKADHDSAKSFYNKAVVTVTDGAKTLTSYKTNVAAIIGGRAYRIGEQPQSNTTARHMREFFIQEGFERMTKKQLSLLPQL